MMKMILEMILAVVVIFVGILIPIAATLIMATYLASYLGLAGIVWWSFVIVFCILVMGIVSGTRDRK